MTFPAPPDMAESIACPICSLIAHYPIDAEQRYCGRCDIFWGVLLDLLEYEGGDVGEVIKLLPRLTNDPAKVVAVATWLLMDKNDGGAGRASHPIPGSATP